MKAATGSDGKFRFDAVIENHTVITGFGLLVFMGEAGIIVLDVLERCLIAVGAGCNRQEANILKVADACAA